MKSLFNFFTILIIISATTSCSKDDIDQKDNLVGVWERNDFIDNTGYKLVFGSDNTGLKIHVTESSTGEIASSASPFEWELADNVVTIVTNDISQETYRINPEGQLVLSTAENSSFNKVSDDYSQYY